jgi:multicomponent Na+:H+ antiporter subunit A
MAVLLCAHFLAAALAPGLVRLFGRRTFLLLALVPAASFGWLLSRMDEVTGEAAHQLTETITWVPAIHLDIALRLDTLSWTLAMLVTGVGALVLVYSGWYFQDGDPSLWRFTGAFTAFAGSMLGLVLARNLLLIYVFWELTTVFSFILIGHNPERRANRRAAVNALMVTTFGGLAMLVGFVMLGEAAGSYQIDDVVLALGHRPASTAVTVAIGLVLVGALSKSALVPFHFWLPGAMAAPTPVSAYLHAAAMVKAGIFLASALAPGFAGTGLWRITLIGLGVLSMLIGGVRALAQTDIKLLLAYGTVSQLGFLMAIVGLGTRSGALAGIAMLTAHALFKAALFMVVGIVDHAAHTRDLHKLSGVGARMPVLFGLTVLAAASMAGIPPLYGFVTKESVLTAFTEALTGHDGQPPVLGTVPGALALGGLVLGAMLTVAYTLRFVWGTFARKSGVPDTELEPTPAPIVGPVAVLAVACLVLGFAGAWLTDLFAGYDHQFAPDGGHATLALWHGVTPALVLSLIAIAGGIGGFAWQQRLAAVPAAPRWMPSAERGYEWAMRTTDRLSVEVTGRTQRGSLPFYLGSILVVVLAVPGSMLIVGGRWPSNLVWFDDGAQVLACAVLVAAAVIAVRSRRRLKAVLLAGVTGYATAVLFLLHGAPDLALTQVLVETVTLVLFVLVLRRLPAHFSSRPFLASRSLRVLLGALAGTFVAGLAAVAAGARVGSPVSDAFADAAVSYGGGRNIVNVTLVDIRAWDTMGEISVLLVAATGVASLIFQTTGRGSRPPPTTTTAGRGAPAGNWLSASRRQRPEQRSMLFEVVARLIFHTIVLFSVWLLFAGHNAPGGGFAGGLMAGLALMVRYLAGGRYELDEAAPVDAGKVLGAGLLVATISVLAPLAFGGQVLQSAVVDLHLPVIGDVHVVTSVFFDVGVYLVVVGVMLDLLRSLGAGIDQDIADERAAEDRPTGLGVDDVPVAGS